MLVSHKNRYFLSWFLQTNLLVIISIANSLFSPFFFYIYSSHEYLNIFFVFDNLVLFLCYVNIKAGLPPLHLHPFFFYISIFILVCIATSLFMCSKRNRLFLDVKKKKKKNVAQLQRTDVWYIITDPLITKL